MLLVARPTELQSAAVTAVCIYEATAILSKRVPTISCGLKALPTVARGITVGAMAVWLVVHVELVKLRRLGGV